MVFNSDSEMTALSFKDFPKEELSKGLKESRYRLLSFDLDRTLYRVVPSYDEAVQRNIVSTIEPNGLDDDSWQRWQENFSTTGRGRETLVRCYGVDPDEARRIVVAALEKVDIKAYIEIFEDLPTIIDELKERGFLIAVLTHSSEDRAREILEYLNLLPRVDYLSCMETSKDGGIAFDALISWVSESGFPITYQGVIHAGDSLLTDILPALVKGVTPVWINPEMTVREDVVTFPDVLSYLNFVLKASK